MFCFRNNTVIQVFADELKISLFYYIGRLRRMGRAPRNNLTGNIALRDENW